jgi:hypothetical protein
MRDVRGDNLTSPHVNKQHLFRNLSIVRSSSLILHRSAGIIARLTLSHDIVRNHIVNEIDLILSSLFRFTRRRRVFHS